MGAVRILLGDDHTVVRQGLRKILEEQPGWQVIAQASDGREAVQQTLALLPDVAVLDIAMPLLNGIEATRQIVRRAPAVHVLILSMHAEEAYVTQAVQAGAKGYLLKDSADSDLVRGVAAVAAGTSFFSPAAAKVMLDDYLRRRVQFGVGWGRFEGEPMLKLWTGWRMSDALSLQGDVGQVQGLYSGSHFWHVGLVSEPWSDRRLSPFFSVGFGRFRNVPQRSLVGAVPTDAKTAHAAFGLRWYLSERFMLHADYTLHTAFVADTRSSEFKAWTAGLAFFF